MSLSVGDRLGPYEILEPIGKGGMGEVYRAHDSRTNRDVAIKTSADQFSERFSREVRAIAALNHPNICTLYDCGPNYLVMELVEGKAPQGPLPFEEAWLIAQQIAAALEAAHEKGIVHRDLKPANIKIKPDGTVKVLDFGLAKAPRPPSSDQSTLSLSLTEPGLLMGTASYMSPEQAQAKPVDKRSDIWAFGVILYELLSGRRLFNGETIQDTLAALLTQDPDWSLVPPAARPLLRRCLERDPARRLRDIGDAAALLGSSPVAGDAVRTTSAGAWQVAAGALALVAGIAAWAPWRAQDDRLLPVSRWEVLLNEIPSESGLNLEISRDGKQLAYVVQSGPSSRILVRDLDQPQGRLIPGTEGGQVPFFSPDGQWLAYVAGPRGALRKVPVRGGSPITLCPGAFFRGGSWGDDDRIVYVGAKGLMRVPASGGPCETLLETAPGEAHGFPQILPGGKAVLFTLSRVLNVNSTARAAVLDLPSHAVREVEGAGVAARYLPTGHLSYARSGVLYAAPFDLEKLAITGSEEAVADDIFYRPNGGIADFTVSNDGLLVYAVQAGAVTRVLRWADLDGKTRTTPAPEQPYGGLRLSPGGRYAAVDFSFNPVGTQAGIWIEDLVRGTSNRLPAVGFNRNQTWTPDGKQVVFSAQVTGSASGIYRAATDGSGMPELLLATDDSSIPSAITPDGQTIVFSMGSPADIWALSLREPAAERKARAAFPPNEFHEIQPSVSPDGEWIAYTSNETGKYQIYARRFGEGGKIPVSAGAGEQPQWVRGGRQILYRDPEQNTLMAVDIETAPEFRPGRPRPLFPLDRVPWDADPNGTRVLIAEPTNRVPNETKLRVVVNWFDELRRRSQAAAK